MFIYQLLGIYCFLEPSPRSRSLCNESMDHKRTVDIGTTEPQYPGLKPFSVTLFYPLTSCLLLQCIVFSLLLFHFLFCLIFSFRLSFTFFSAFFLVSLSSYLWFSFAYHPQLAYIPGRCAFRRFFHSQLRKKTDGKSLLAHILGLLARERLFPNRLYFTLLQFNVK